MRIREVWIEEFMGVTDVGVETSGVTVLFGANSSGKTGVLDAIRAALRGAGDERVDELDPFSGPLFSGYVSFELDGADVAGHPDGELYRRLLCGEVSGPQAWDWLDPDATELLVGQSVPDARSFLADRMVTSGAAGSHADRLLLADTIVGSKLFRSEPLMTSLYIADPSESVRQAALRIANAPGDNSDALWKAASGLVDSGWARITNLAAGFEETEDLRAMWPDIESLSLAPEGIEERLERDVDVIHDLLFDSGNLGTSGSKYDLSSADPRVDWVEWMAPETGMVSLNSPDNQAANWCRIRRSVLHTVELLEARANEVAPSFIADIGRIVLRVRPLHTWAGQATRLEVGIADAAGDVRGLAVSGAGTRRWVAASVQLAGADLRSRQLEVLYPNGIPAEPGDRSAIVNAGRGEPASFGQFRLVPPQYEIRPILLVDEPEAHLHPAAARSAADWLTAYSRTAPALIVATHAPAFLNVAAADITPVLVRRDGSLTKAVNLQDNVFGGLSRYGAELGMGPGELLLLTRLALFVEGPHDQAVLDAMFGHELRAAGVRLFAVHGVDNLPGLAASEVLTALGLPLGVLTDNAPSGKPRGLREQAGVERLIREVSAAGGFVKVFGLEKPDIVEYLDDDICRTKAPRFPGWERSVAAWRKVPSDPRPKFKEFVTRTYGLRLDRGSVRLLAEECFIHGAVPSEMRNVIKGIISWAQDGCKN